MPAQSSKIPAQPSTITGLTLTFIATQPCYDIVPVTDGFVGPCTFGYGNGGDAATGPAFIGNDGVVTGLPDPYNFSRYFSDGADNLVAKDSMPPGPLLVIEPTSGAVKKAIPLPYSKAWLIGLTGTTAVLGSATSGDGGSRMMAYDVSGAKKWDVPFPDPGRMHVEVTPAGVLVFELTEKTGKKETRPPTPRARMLRLDDGSTLWDRSGKGLGVPVYEPVVGGVDRGGQTRAGRSVLSQRVGRTVLYDNAGVPRSLTTGAPTGRGPGPSAGAVAYEDDLILTNPLRRMTPDGETVWTLQDTSGTPATDGKTLVVLDTNDLVVLDPATGQRLGQTPDATAPLNPCGPTEIIVATPRVLITGGWCRAGTSVYTVNM